jgi:hypothetical protein
MVAMLNPETVGVKLSEVIVVRTPFNPRRYKDKIAWMTNGKFLLTFER